MATAQTARSGINVVFPYMSEGVDSLTDTSTVDLEDREALKSFWTQKPALIETVSGRVMQAVKIVKPQNAPFVVQFSSGVAREADVKYSVEDLLGQTPMPDLKHIILGAVGGEFRERTGAKAARILSVTTVRGGMITVMATSFAVGATEPPESSAKGMGWAAFWAKYKPTEKTNWWAGAAADDASERVSIRPFKCLREVMTTAKMDDALLDTEHVDAYMVPLDTLQSLVVAAMQVDGYASSADVLAAARQLDKAMAAAASGKRAWYNVMASGFLHETSGDYVGRSISSIWFGGKKPKVTYTPAGPPARGGSGSADDGAGLGLEPDEEDDSSSEDSDDEDDDVAPKATPKRRQQATTSDAEESEVELVPPAKKKKVTESPAIKLQSLAPRLETCDVIFEIFGDALICEVADEDVFTEEMAGTARPVAMAMRYGHALRRLIKVIGDDWWPDKPLRSLEAVGMLREEIRNIVRQAKRSGSSVSPVHFNTSGGGQGLGAAVEAKPAAPLSAENAERAVPSVVAARLHQHAGVIEQAWNAASGSVGLAVASVTGTIRADLQRALGSNTRVDAAGEQAHAKRHLPPVAPAIRRGLIEEVVADLQAVALEDASGRQFMTRSAAIELADEAVLGDVSLETFTAASRKMLLSSAQPKGSLGELQDAWALVHKALSAVAQRMLLRSSDEGLNLLDRRIRVTARATHAKLDKAWQDKFVGEQRQWAQRVLDSWSQAMVAFRMGVTEAPTMKLVMDGCEQIYSFSNMAAQLRADQKPYVGSPANRPPNQKQQGAPRVATVTKTSAKRRRGKAKGKFERMRADASDDEDGGDDSDDDTVAPTPAAKGGKKKGAAKGGNLAWPDRPRFTTAGFKDMKAKCIAQYPKHCTFQLMGVCNQGAKCKFDHNIPKGFVKWATDACSDCEQE